VARSQKQSSSLLRSAASRMPPTTSACWGMTTTIRYRSIRRSQWHHRPRCRDIEQWTQSSNVRVKAGPPEVAGSPIDEHCIGPTQRLRAEPCRIKTDSRHSLLGESGVLPVHEAGAIATTCEEELTWPPNGHWSASSRRLSLSASGRSSRALLAIEAF
jgi:hypothetical protein